MRLAVIGGHEQSDVRVTRSLRDASATGTPTFLPPTHSTLAIYSIPSSMDHADMQRLKKGEVNLGVSFLFGFQPQSHRFRYRLPSWPYSSTAVWSSVQIVEQPWGPISLSIFDRHCLDFFSSQHTRQIESPTSSLIFMTECIVVDLAPLLIRRL